MADLDNFSYSDLMVAAKLLTNKLSRLTLGSVEWEQCQEEYSQVLGRIAARKAAIKDMRHGRN